MKKLELVLSALCLVLSALCLVLVPGFYYTLRGSGGLEGLEGVEGVDVYGPVLCEPDKPVTFEAVEKPSDAAGFFTIGVSTGPTFMPVR